MGPRTQVQQLTTESWWVHVLGWNRRGGVEDGNRSKSFLRFGVGIRDGSQRMASVNCSEACSKVLH